MLKSESDKTANTEYTIRHATTADIETIVSHRRRMFAEMGRGTSESLDAMDEVAPNWLRDHIEASTYIGFLMEHEEKVIGGAGLYLIDWQPSPFTAQTTRPYVANVYVEPEFRRQGVARRLVAAILDFCRDAGHIDVWLHASDAGRPVYESMGFLPTSELRIALD